MSFLSFIGDIFKPAADLVDSLHTSDEEKMTLKNKMIELQNTVSLKVLEYEKSLMENKASIIKAEAQGHSWLQRNWRPITMLTFLCLAVGDSFGLLATKLAPEAWTLLQIGLGGYIAGRSVEKIAPQLTQAWKGRKDHYE